MNLILQKNVAQIPTHQHQGWWEMITDVLLLPLDGCKVVVLHWLQGPRTDLPLLRICALILSLFTFIYRRRTIYLLPSW